MPPAFLIITAFASIPQAVEALKAGADNFLTKPLDFDHMLICIDRALDVRRLKLEVQVPPARDHGILGDSRPIRMLLYQIRQIAQTSGPVLVCGESGVGKELVAQAIHRQSPRKEFPFVPVNCAGIPETLLETEFFGHAAGAFTGAQKSRRGLFQEAEGGVLFLDEITELPLPMQAKLLRVLQNNAVRPVGSNVEVPINVRVIAASNRRLQNEVQSQRFRQDLYYRLETFVLRVPPLRERERDIELLAAHFLSLYALENQKEIHSFSQEALQVLRQYAFPGNIRELQNIIRWAVTFSKNDRIEAENLPDSLNHGPATSPPSSASPPGIPPKLLDQSHLPTLEEMKARYIQHVLEKTGGNKRRAAALLGIERHTLYKYLPRK